ncbi:MAG TPA: hypothetical protein VGT98_16475, partial [Candidatus Elarobacter sp.]|nr:hypothetical protein [Candidatus Elarobacter sp.]
SARALLHERAELDWTELTVTFSDSRALPVSRRIAREALHSALHRTLHGVSDTSRAPGGVRAPMLPAALSFDYALASATDPSRDLVATLHLGAAMLSGALDATWSLPAPDRGARRIPSLAWLRPIDGGRFARQFRVGDMANVPLAGRLRDAIALSSESPVSTADFGSITLAGVAPPASDVEVIVNGELQSWATADARGDYRVRVPLAYGENRIVLATHDSAGELRALRERNVVVGRDVLPARSIQYTLAHGRCGDARCRSASAAEVRAAPTDRVTARVGVVAWRDTSGSSLHAGFGLSARVADAVGATLDAMPHGATSVSVAAGSSSSATMRASFRWLPRGPSWNGAQQGYRSGTSSLEWRPFATPRVALHADGVYGASAPRSTRTRVALTFAGQKLRAEPFVRLATGQRSPERKRMLSPGLVLAAFAFGGSLPVALHLAASPDERSLTGSLLAFHSISIDANATWRVHVQRPALRITLARPLPIGRYSMTSIGSGDRPVAFSQSIDGSFVADLAGARLRAVSRSGFGALRGVVFADLNRNGSRDAGEPAIAGAELSVEGVRATTDARGEYLMWGLVPLTPLLVRVESLPAPYVLGTLPLRVELLPDGVTVLDVPIDPP